MPRRVPQYRPPLLAKVRRTNAVAYEHSSERKADKAAYADRRWRKWRQWFLSGHPTCQDCMERGVVAEATEVHHVVKRKDDRELAFDEANCMALCKACHSVRTNRGE